MSCRVYTLAAIALVALPQVSTAQQSRERGFDQQQQQRTETGLQRQGDQSSEELVQYLAGKLMITNQLEIELAQMASQQTENPEVRQLAERLVQDHRQLNEQIKQKVPQAEAIADLDAISGQSDRAGQQGQQRQNPQQQQQQQQQQQRRQTVAESQAGQLDGPAQQLMNICKQAAKNHLRMSKDMLTKKQGQDFDMAFLGQQIGGHAWLVAELQAIQEAGPEQLQQLAKQSEQVSQQHLDKAKQLAKNVEDELREGAPTAGRPTRRPR